jgi:hypothetical protein
MSKGLSVNVKSLTRYTLLASGSRHDSTFTIWDVAQGMAIYWILLYFGSCYWLYMTIAPTGNSSKDFGLVWLLVFSHLPPKLNSAFGFLAGLFRHWDTSKARVWWYILVEVVSYG